MALVISKPPVFFCFAFLFDILHTPCMSSNLASISKLCKDKDTYVEFHLSDFFRKDSTSQAIHAQSNVAGGLCVF